MQFEPGGRIRVPDRPDLAGFVRIESALAVGDGWRLVVEHPPGSFAKVELTATQATACDVVTEDGTADSAALLAGLWTVWMCASGTGARSAVLVSELRPHAHQMNAVYGAMLPQPRLRFLLADEPGTGKTIMAGLYLREMQRLGLVRRALVVVPAHLVTKWQADFERFFGGGLRPITAQTVREHGLEGDHDLWVVSLDLLAVNGAVQDAVHPDRMGWDAVVFDEAHRLTPTAVGYYQAGQMLALNTPRALFMTATPHRGKEWLFRALLHLVDPEVYPPVESNKEPSRSVKPGRVHFLRRMKEDLVDFDGVTKLFKGRHAENRAVPLSTIRHPIDQVSGRGQRGPEGGEEAGRGHHRRRARPGVHRHPRRHLINQPVVVQMRVGDQHRQQRRVVSVCQAGHVWQRHMLAPPRGQRLSNVEHQPRPRRLDLHTRPADLPAAPVHTYPHPVPIPGAQPHAGATADHCPSRVRQFQRAA